MSKIIYKTIKDQTIVWFSITNSYIVVSNATAKIISLLEQLKSINQISSILSEELEINEDEVKTAVLKIKNEVYLPNTLNNITNNKQNEIQFDGAFKITKFYKINELIFKIDYQTEVEEFWVHPKFEHLVVSNQNNYNFHFKVFSDDKHIAFSVNNKFIGSWEKENVHYFQGKFSMEIVQAIHNKPEKDWLGVFHASAVGNKDKAMLFLGDSGNGKSTSLALLQANGFTCIADDFVPVNAEKQEVYSFPSAISIKKNSVPILIDLYPELTTTAEYHLKALNKIVRYLPPNNNNYTKHLPCDGLVFIKYNPNIELNITRISNIEAFEQLVPDSWLSPEEENAASFLNWFAQLPCYSLTYADNAKMIATVNQLFNNEL